MDLSYLGSLMTEQLEYIREVLNQRNQHSDEAFATEIKTILKGELNETKTPYGLGHHGLQPLVFNLINLIRCQDPSFEFTWERSPSEITVPSFLKMYARVSDIAIQAFSDIDVDNLSGKLESFRGDPRRIEKRFTKLVMHTIHHMGQAIQFHGLICQYLGNQDS